MATEEKKPYTYLRLPYILFYLFLSTQINSLILQVVVWDSKKLLYRIGPTAPVEIKPYSILRQPCLIFFSIFVSLNTYLKLDLTSGSSSSSSSMRLELN